MPESRLLKSPFCNCVPWSCLPLCSKEGWRELNKQDFTNPPQLLIPTVDPGNHPVLSLYVLSLMLPILSYTVTVLSGSTCWPLVVQYLDTNSRHAINTNRPYLKGKWPVVNIPNLASCQNGKSLVKELAHLNRTSREHTRTSRKEKSTRRLQHRQAGKYIGLAGFISLTHILSVMQSLSIR